MKYWGKDTGIKFKNSDKCYGYAYNPGSGTIDIATITIKGRFPDKGWGYLEEAHEMAIVVKGSGYIKTKAGQEQNLSVGDVVYIEPKERFSWVGDIDLVVPCGPAFDPEKHHLEEDE